MAAQAFKVPELKVATAEVKEEKKEGPLFYILPPLVVLAVFVYCMVSVPPMKSESAVDEDEAAIEMIEAEESDEELE